MRPEATAVPSTRPPGPVRFVVFEFTCEEDGYQNLVYGALDGNDSNETQDSVRGVPKLEEPL